MIFKRIIFSLSLALFSMMANAELSINDLGFKSDELKIDPEISKTLEVRKDKLELHQKLGLATMGLMAATMITHETAKTSDSHKYFGIATGLMYYTTAYFSLTAPEVQGVKESGSTKIHKTLAWIHFPLMVAAPILGYLHKKNMEDNKASSGLVKSHGGIGGAAFATFMLSGLVMYFDFSF